jgi:hypothetical protein
MLASELTGTIAPPIGSPLMTEVTIHTLVTSSKMTGKIALVI